MTLSVKQFIQANTKAYAVASKVFKAIEAEDFASTLAEAGIMGDDVRVFATIYVAEQTGVKPHPSQRGGALTFTKDTSEYNRARYLADVALGVRDARKAKKQSSPRIDVPRALRNSIVDQIIAAGLEKQQFNALLAQLRDAVEFK